MHNIAQKTWLSSSHRALWRGGLPTRGLSGSCPFTGYPFTDPGGLPLLSLRPPRMRSISIASPTVSDVRRFGDPWPAVPCMPESPTSSCLGLPRLRGNSGPHCERRVASGADGGISDDTALLPPLNDPEVHTTNSTRLRTRTRIALGESGHQVQDRVGPQEEMPIRKARSNAQRLEPRPRRPPPSHRQPHPQVTARIWPLLVPLRLNPSCPDAAQCDGSSTAFL